MLWVRGSLSSCGLNFKFPPMRIFLRVVLISLCFIGSARAQVYIPFYDEVANQVSAANILENLNSFESFGEKYRGTQAQANTLTWLRAQYLSFGYTESQLTEDSFSYSGSTCKNLVVTKIGTLYPNTFVIIDGHYDTVNGPGTNDNGSGVAVILEAARLLRNIPTEYSIKFINFSGEEDGLIGSQHYVDQVVNATTPKMNIRLVLNLDQVGGIAGATNNTITCERDTSSPFSNNMPSNAMTNQLANCIELYSPLQTVIASAYGSDYVPFENNGEIITGLYETNESPFSHTANDLLVNMDSNYVYNVAKGATGAILHFAIACTTCTLNVPENENHDFVLYPNPAADMLTFANPASGENSYSVTFVNSLGQIAMQAKIENADATESIDISSLSAGLYFVRIDSAAVSTVKKILVR